MVGDAGEAQQSQSMQKSSEENMSAVMASDGLPTLYQYYAGGNISSGLLADNSSAFSLNAKHIQIFSGAMHYFRVPRDKWRDRLRKMRAAGLNTVETYVPWNEHEPQEGKFNFEDNLDLGAFLKAAQEEDLLAIVRPGPYICAEWEFGGLPSWLLRYEGMQMRSSKGAFVQKVQNYFGALLPIIAALQFINGGPVVAVQIENEYGNVKENDNEIDTAYLQALKKMLESHNITSLFFTSDTPTQSRGAGSLPGVLQTANFLDNAVLELTTLREMQPNRPLMVMEFWSGWFDHWSEPHHTRPASNLTAALEDILSFPASVNFYMFHGGTSFGFKNGANIYLYDRPKMVKSFDNEGFEPDISSYDYDAPLTEAGDYTDKYDEISRLIAKYSKVKTRLPERPALEPREMYDPVSVELQMSLGDLLPLLPKFSHETPMAMELLDLNDGNGQSYGYIVYRKTGLNIARNSVLKIAGRVCDTVMVLINGQLKSKIIRDPADLDEFGTWRVKDSTLALGDQDYQNATLDLVVENWGRVNYGLLPHFKQHKGLWQGPVSISGKELADWTVYPLEFKREWLESLEFSQKLDVATKGPTVYMASLVVPEGRLADTFLDMRGWIKGVVFVNGFALGRFCQLGPQQSLYLPRSVLKTGKNTVVVFEHFEPQSSIKFSKNIIFS